MVMLFVFSPRLVLYFFRRTANFFLDYLLVFTSLSSFDCCWLFVSLGFLSLILFMRLPSRFVFFSKSKQSKWEPTLEMPPKKRWKENERHGNNYTSCLPFSYCNSLVIFGAAVVLLTWHGHDCSISSSEMVSDCRFVWWWCKHATDKHYILLSQEMILHDTRQVMPVKAKTWRCHAQRDQRFNWQERIMDDIQYQYVMITETSTGKLTVRLPSLTSLFPTGKLSIPGFYCCMNTLISR